MSGPRSSEYRAPIENAEHDVKIELRKRKIIYISIAAFLAIAVLVGVVIVFQLQEEIPDSTDKPDTDNPATNFPGAAPPKTEPGNAPPTDSGVGVAKVNITHNQGDFFGSGDRPVTSKVDPIPPRDIPVPRRNIPVPPSSGSGDFEDDELETEEVYDNRIPDYNYASDALL